jgi:hypothetical protein
MNGGDDKYIHTLLAKSIEGRDDFGKLEIYGRVILKLTATQ